MTLCNLHYEDGATDKVQRVYDSECDMTSSEYSDTSANEDKSFRNHIR